MANKTTNESGNRLTGAPTNVRIPPNYPVEPMPGKVEQLLLYNEHAIYHKYKPYTENTNLLKFGREQPYIYTYIDEKNKPILPPVPRGTSILQSQAIPIESGTTDLVRITRYLTSGRGIEFLTKQLLLQAQQPYDETGIYNPLEVPLAVASSTTLGIIPRPVRNINISGGILGALTSIIGINISNGNSATPSSVGQDALPTIGSTTGRGLLRAKTAIKGKSTINTLWPDGPQPSVLGGKGFFGKLVQSAVKMAVDTAKAFFPPAFPLRQKRGNYARYRQDEVMYDRMRADVNGRLVASNRYETDSAPEDSNNVYPVPLNRLRTDNLKSLTNNRSYKSIPSGELRMQWGPKDKYLSQYKGSRSLVVDSSIPSDKNLRMARAGAGDGINQLGVLNKTYNKRLGPMNGSPIESSPKNYTGWTYWKPYEDDLIAFFFYDIVNTRFIPFRSTIKGINDTTTANWDELRFIGRADQVYTYNGFVRSLAFQFSVVISSLEDLLPTWQKLNYMKTSLKPAGYTSKGDYVYNRFMIPPMFTLTIGDMYKHQPIVITNFNVTVPENANWETLNEDNAANGWYYLNTTVEGNDDSIGTYAQLPKEVEVSVTCNLLEKERAVCGGADFGHAPRGDDGKFLKEDPDKPYMPNPTEFSKRIVRNKNSLAFMGTVMMEDVSNQSNAGSTVPPAPAMDKLKDAGVKAAGSLTPSGTPGRTSIP